MLGACRLSFQRMIAARTLFPLRQSVARLPRRGRATQAAATKSKDKEAREAELKKKSLADAVKKLNSRYPGAVVSVHDAFAPVDTVSTGAMTLDIALGGGYPKGRIIEIYGPESSGKTTLALHAIAEVQKQGGSAVFIDAEHALSPEYAIALGVDFDTMLTSQPESGEQAMEIARELIKSAAVDIVVVDSVAALVPQAELDGEVGNQQMALQARLMSKGLRGLAGVLSKTGCILIFVNQLRQKVGVIYGSNEVTTGGHGLKYFASVRIDIRKVSSGNIMDGSEQVGFRAKAKVAKNKVARPFLTGEFDILFGRGINSEGCVFDVAESYKIITRRGAYYYYGEMKLGQGRQTALRTVSEDPELLPKIKDEIQVKLDEERKMHAEKRAETIGGESPPPFEGSDEEMTEDEFEGTAEPL